MPRHRRRPRSFRKSWSRRASAPSASRTCPRRSRPSPRRTSSRPASSGRQDFIALTPNVSQVQTAEAGDMQVVIRGINTGRDAETNFALVVDGVLQTNPNALNQELTNVTQIEVLKGPQGALYGRNAARRRNHPDDAQARRRSRSSNSSAGYGSDNSLQGQPVRRRPDRRQRSRAASPPTRAAPTASGTTRSSAATTAWITSRRPARSGACVFGAGDSGEIDVKAKVSTIESGAINFNASLALAEAAAVPRRAALPGGRERPPVPSTSTTSAR